MLDLKKRRLLGHIGVGLLASFRVSTVRGLEFTINSTSVIKVLGYNLGPSPFLTLGV